jgi:nucleoside-diphosphate-sugar epimerase
LNILERQHNDADLEAPDIVWVAGQGLIGGALSRTLCRAYGFVENPIAYPWNDPPSVHEAFSRDLVRRVINQAQSLDAAAARPPRLRISMVWAAGVAGFDVDRKGIEPELRHFQRFLDGGREIESALPQASLRVLLVSSAGGLFEGQRVVDDHSTPQPKRPYGELKLEQERLLQSRFSPDHCLIYRPSSVYGQVSPRHRSGLIATLINSAVRHRVTTITGSLSTLRDYIHTDDLARFLAKEILSEKPMAAGRPLILATSRSTSIVQLRHIIERVARRKVYIVQKSAPDNAEDITFSPGLIPHGFLPMDIETGVRRVYLGAVSGVCS